MKEVDYKKTVQKQNKTKQTKSRWIIPSIKLEHFRF